MKIFWESPEWPGAVVEPSITCLNWVPNASKPGTGLLAAGSESGIVGVTSTELSPQKDDASCINFNLRGHRRAISIVAWNHQRMKLASCDLAGMVYMWVPNEGRWSVELVNDRGVEVRDICWSPSGESLLICYEDNFVLIGSASGQRIWSSSLTNPVSCGVWSPDSREVILGLNTGVLQFLTEQGTTITERSLFSFPIQRLASSSFRANDEWTLAVWSSSNDVTLLRNHGDASCISWRSTEPISDLQWNSSGTLLAVIAHPNRVTILNDFGRVLYSRPFPFSSSENLNAFTWAHNDQIVIAAAGGHVMVGRVVLEFPRLSFLVTYSLWVLMGQSSQSVNSLPLPLRERRNIQELDHHVIRCRVPTKEMLYESVCEPTPWQWYCAVKPVPDSVRSYTLCFEHMGGLIPVLMSKQSSRIIPQFQISLYDASCSEFCHQNAPMPDSGCSSQVEDIGTLNGHSLQQNSIWRRSRRRIRAVMNRHLVSRQNMDSADGKLVQIISNAWCTRFKIISLHASPLPRFLAQVLYKTSFLHSNPRQMTVDLADLRKHRTEISFQEMRDSHHLNSHERLFGNEQRSGIAKEPNCNGMGDLKLFCDRNFMDENGLLYSRKSVHESIFTNFNDLRVAVERHIVSMKCFADELKESSQKLEPMFDFSHPSTSSQWPRHFDDIEYIDEDDVMVHVVDCKNSEEEAMLEIASSAFDHRQKGMIDQFNDILSILDKLFKSANDPSLSCTSGNCINNASLRAESVSVNLNASDGSTMSVLIARLKEIASQLEQIEKKVYYGDRLLGEMCDDLQRRIHTLKRFPSKRTSHDNGMSLLTMHNKTPLWNEASHVYQLDFGGRVTRESAKNFQIEFEQQQVLSFGRTEDGSFILDFRSPFTAVQAFSVALAATTQRFK